MKKVKFGKLISWLVCMFIGSLATAVAQAPADGVSLRSMLLSQYKRGYLIGHHDDPMYGHQWTALDRHTDGSDVKAVTGCYPALMTFDLGHIELGDSVNLDGVPFCRIREEISRQYRRGGIVSLSWHADNPVTGGSAWDNSDSTVVHRILNDKKIHEKFLRWLDHLAEFLQSVKEPVILRPWHEHTGSWFWWGRELCSRSDYLALWQLTVGWLESKGLRNVVYAYSPGIEPQNADEYLERYPGDRIVSLIGVDAYQYNGKAGAEEFRQHLTRLLGIMEEVCQTHPVAMALTECGLESVVDSLWFTQTLAPIIDRYPLAYVQFWRNAHDNPTHFYVPYPGHKSAADFKQFCMSPKAFMIK